ncbi:MAG: SusC/RagA family TonB-linked outer membrane protein [Puia sp.]|nr:SusC/RagA family TonB-linked outer membrane protein [Puia sp.]
MVSQKLRFLRVFTLLILTLTAQAAFSQTKTITGKISDDKGNPVQGATVTAKGTKAGTSTDAGGSFSFSVPAGTNTLVVSSVGFAEQEVSITDRTTIAVSLVSSSQSLNDVVVIGYGTARRKDLTGAVSSVQAKDFNLGPVAAPDQLLQNKVPGVEVSTSSGQPGGGSTIKIRGNTSILSGVNNPLVVLDGVPLDGRDAKPTLNLGANGLPFGTTPNSNPLLYINPADVQQIEILKDASSSAIYGSRGANGVIVITTKKATAGPVRLDFGTSIGDNVGFMKTNDPLSASQYRANLQKYNLTSAGYDSGASVNPLKSITQHTLSQSYNLGISGGNENGKFRASFLASSQQGLIKTTDLDKYLGTFGGNYKFFNKRVTIDFNLIVGHTTQDEALVTNTPGAGGNLISWALNWNPTVPFYNSDGSFKSLALNTPNPLATLAAYSDRSNVTTILGNISATVRLFKGLDYKFLYAINDGNGTRYTNFDGWIAGIQGISSLGMGAISTANITSQTFTHTLNYHADLSDKLRMDAVVGYEYWQTNYRDQTLLGTGFDINNSLATQVPILNTSQIIDAATRSVSPANPSDPSVEIQSVFGRVNFNLSDKYYLTGTMRADGSSKFGTNNHYGYFPSVGARWVISNEDFMKSSAVFNSLALRGSWGITGTQDFPAGASKAQFVFPENQAIAQTNVPNPNLKWQQTNSVDVGVDYSLLAGRIFGSIDYYHKNTTNIIYETNAIQPAPSGNEFINLNANLINSGFEFLIGATIVDHKDFGWEAAFNISYNKNLLKNFNEAPILTGKVSGNGLSGTFAEQVANNQPVDVYYMPRFYGFTKTGLDSVSSNSYYVGDPNPHELVGFSNTFRYQKWALILNIGGSFGYKVFNNTALAITNIGNFGRGQNVNKYAFADGQSLANGTTISDRWLENGNFIKLRNATIRYTLGNIGQYFRNVSFYATGTNLFVLTKFHGFDPEVNIDKSNTDASGANTYSSRSMEFIPYPTPRIITVGLNFSL